MTESRQIQAWVDAAREGDASAVCKLLAKYHPRFRARLEARMDPVLKVKMAPEDVLQEAYLDVFRRLNQLEQRGAESFFSWVTKILDNRLIDTQRALRCQKRDIDREMSPHASVGSESYWNLLDELYADSTTPSQVARHEEAVGALQACLSCLSDLHRQVIQLRFLEGVSVAEVAVELGKSERTVVSLTKSALRALRESMDRLGEFTRGA